MRVWSQNVKTQRQQILLDLAHTPQTVSSVSVLVPNMSLANRIIQIPIKKAKCCIVVSLPPYAPKYSQIHAISHSNTLATCHVRVTWVYKRAVNRSPRHLECVPSTRQINQPITQSFKQSHNQFANSSSNNPTKQSNQTSESRVILVPNSSAPIIANFGNVDRSIGQGINPSINQSINQTIAQPVCESFKQ